RGGTHVECWNCRRPLTTRPLRLELRSRGARAGAAAQHTVVLETNAKLFAHHTDRGRYDFSRWTGTVQAPPPMLPHRSQQKWSVVHAEHSDEQHEIAPGRQLDLKPGMRVRFASADGDVLG